MARHSKLVIFYRAFQRVSHYLGYLITTGKFLRFLSLAIPVEFVPIQTRIR